MSLDPRLRYADGNQVATQQWVFTTGDDEGQHFAFGPPTTLGDHGFIKSVLAHGTGVVVVWAGPGGLRVSSSSDGDSFQVSKPLSHPVGGDGVEEVDARIINGVLHVAWRTLHGSTAHVLYAHSTGAPDEMSDPLLLTDMTDLPATSPTVTSDGQGTVYVAWRESCLCGDDDQGIHLRASYDGGESFEAPVGVFDSTLWSPALAWVDGGLLAAWQVRSELRLVDALDDFTPLVTLGETGGRHWPFRMLETDSGGAMLLWREGPGIGATVHFLGRVERRDDQKPWLRELAREPDDRTDACTQMGVGASADVLLMISTGQLFGDADRTLRLSTDGGETLGPPQTLRFLLDWSAGDAPSDSFCPRVAIDDERTAYLAWEHSDRGYEPRIARGAPSAPCSY
ncbi:MAG: hypothetical protein PVI30_08025 [Myxococcales bacterium]